MCRKGIGCLWASYYTCTAAEHAPQHPPGPAGAKAVTVMLKEVRHWWRESLPDFPPFARRHTVPPFERLPADAGRTAAAHWVCGALLVGEACALRLPFNQLRPTPFPAHCQCRHGHPTCRVLPVPEHQFPGAAYSPERVHDTSQISSDVHALFASAIAWMFSRCCSRSGNLVENM